MRRLPSSHGLTCIEVVVVVVSIGILAALAIPAIQSMRESARRGSCDYRLAQIGVAVAEYQLANAHYPAGTIAAESPVQSVPQGFHHSWVVALLPYLDQQALVEQIDPTASVYADSNSVLRETPLATVRCPSATSEATAMASNYAGITSSLEQPISEQNDGMFLLNRGVLPAELQSGQEHTLFLGEKLADRQQNLGWASGTRATLRNVARPVGEVAQMQDPLWVGGLASQHPGGVNLLMGSGRIRFYADGGDQAVLQQMARRAGGSPALADENAAL